MPNLLEIDGITKKYGHFTALDEVSLTVQRGDMFGLLGPNGAGKTTLLSIISCLMDPTNGRMRLDGEPLLRSDRNIRRRIGIVPQELALYGELTARENLRFIGQLYDLSGAQLRKHTAEVLELTGLTERADQQAQKFSGGMQRRLNLGLALMHRPELLLLDEPTAGVDAQSRNHIFEGVKRLNAEGMTIIYTSHYMEEVQTLCSRVGIIDHGKLIACDELSKLLQTLDGLVRFQVPEITPTLRQKLDELAVEKVRQKDESKIEIDCRDVTSTVLQVVALLNELQMKMTNLETVQPNLERVFLDLTGRALRD